MADCFAVRQGRHVASKRLVFASVCRIACTVTRARYVTVQPFVSITLFGVFFGCLLFLLTPGKPRKEGDARIRIHRLHPIRDLEDLLEVVVRGGDQIGVALGLRGVGRGVL